ncbi:hypothetical protein [Paractinoplanes toevensis]|uniref:Uncharacterized protein n=1 Tax=Paractinoplanes toevensis TaxID=571911 RepID=A0A919T8A7_9ACTN|nr:hypothetical protein [Actinoplanes toevensis]GIM89710.1 hypothetical protein Ato02nite_015030 [Actinoplanes toevensis]
MSTGMPADITDVSTQLTRLAIPHQVDGDTIILVPVDGVTLHVRWHPHFGDHGSWYRRIEKGLTEVSGPLRVSVSDPSDARQVAEAVYEECRWQQEVADAQAEAGEQ